MTKKNTEAKPSAKNKNSKVRERLDEVLAFMDAENLNALEISEGGIQIKLVRQSAGGVVAGFVKAGKVTSPVRLSTAEVKAESDATVKSPIAGVFYRAPSPESPPYVKEGDVVKAGQVLCVVEAMKVMNEITAERSGRVTKLLVENGKSIEADQPILILDAVR